jgi:hypothetical protein
VKKTNEEVYEQVLEALSRPAKAPLKYILTHEGPNRKERRRDAKVRRLQTNHFDSWVRQLLAAGVNPMDVMAQRQERENNARSKTSGDGPASGGDAVEDQVS